MPPTIKPCAVPGCERVRKNKSSMCVAHRERKRRGQPLEGPIQRRIPRDKDRPPCEASGCYRPMANRGLCSAHYRRRYTRKVVDWETAPLQLKRAKGTTWDVAVRVPVEVKDALDRQAKAHGYTRANWLRAILEKQAQAWLRNELLGAR